MNGKVDLSISSSAMMVCSFGNQRRLNDGRRTMSGTILDGALDQNIITTVSSGRASSRRLVI